MMWIKRASVALIALITVGYISGVILFSAAWSGTELTANLGTDPTIDGIMEDSWKESVVNSSNHEFSGGRRITLHTQYTENYIYFLIEVKFETTFKTETISLYISSSSKTEDIDFLDKKQITMQNASEKGNESYVAYDLYRNSNGDYVKDIGTLGFEGAAKIGPDPPKYRYYEIKIALNPENETNDDVKLIISSKYAIKVGINNTLVDEERSPALVIQIGPKPGTEKDDSNKFPFNVLVYIRIVIGIVTGILVIYGIALIISNPKISDIEVTSSITKSDIKKNNDEEHEDADEEEAED
jgi:hypothetical protein